MASNARCTINKRGKTRRGRTKTSTIHRKIQLYEGGSKGRYKKTGEWPWKCEEGREPRAKTIVKGNTDIVVPAAFFPSWMTGTSNERLAARHSGQGAWNRTLHCTGGPS